MIGAVDVLDRDFIPKDLHHRDGHIQDLRQALGGIPDARADKLITIYGPPGAGKTTLAKYVTRRFASEYPELKTAYVDCISANTRTSLLRDVLADTGHLPTSASTTTSSYDYLAVLREATEPILVIVDELDYLTEPELIKALWNTRGVWAIFIGSQENKLLAGMEPGIRNRLQTARMIRLSHYTNTQMADILWSRIDLGIPRELVKPGAIQRIVERARGDAHIAIAILRNCVDQLDPHRPTPITSDLVEDLEAAVVVSVRERYIERLATHPRLLYTLIKNADSITVSALKQAYLSEAINPRSDSMRRKYLASLEDDNLIYSTGSGLGKRYHVNNP